MVMTKLDPYLEKLIQWSTRSVPYFDQKSQLVTLISHDPYNPK